MSAPLTTRQAAERIGVTEGRIRQLIIAGRLQATKFGRSWMIDPEDLEAFRQEQKEQFGAFIEGAEKD